jgi:hypothetical protein
LKKSTYLDHPQRLADIMAAIQVMGTHVWDTRPVEHWVNVLGRWPLSVETKKWDDVFDRHPEFFGKEIWRTKKEKEGIEEFVYYLRWRRAGERTFNPDNLKELNNDEIEALKAGGIYEDKRLTRKPLTPEQIGTLLTAAIDLQDRAISFEARSRWWLPVVISFVTALFGILGVVVGAMLKVKS